MKKLFTLNLMGLLRRLSLTVRLTSQPEMYALIRIRHKVEWIDYVLSPGYLIMAILAFATSICAVLAFTFAFLEVMLRHLTGMPIAMWQTWLQNPLRTSVPPIFTFTPDGWSNLQLAFESACFVSALLLGISCWIAKEAAGNVRSVFLFTFRSPSSTSSPRVSRLTRISTPLGLLPEIIDAPSLTSVLDLLQDSANLSRPLGEILADYASAETENRKQTPVTIRVSMSHLLTITLIGLDGKQLPCFLKNPSWVALVAYLAIQPRSTWIAKNAVLNTIYGGTKDAQYSLCKMHVRRIHHFLAEEAEEIGLLLEQGGRRKTRKSLPITLIEHDVRDKSRPWGLTPACEVEIFPRMEVLYQQVRLAAEGKSPLLTLWELYSRCEEMMQEYGRGFLADHQPWHRTWRWARDLYIEHRNMCLHILDYAIQRTRNTLTETELAPDERSQVLDRVAMLYKWFALAASGLIPKEEQAEQALQESLAIFLELKDITAAEDAYQDYAESLAQKGEMWQPQPTTEELWEKVMAQATASRRYQRVQESRKRSSQKSRSQG